jgi:hypothetical protein
LKIAAPEPFKCHSIAILPFPRQRESESRLQGLPPSASPDSPTASRYWPSLPIQPRHCRQNRQKGSVERKRVDRTDQESQNCGCPASRRLHPFHIWLAHASIIVDRQLRSAAWSSRELLRDHSSSPHPVRGLPIKSHHSHHPCFCHPMP